MSGPVLGKKVITNCHPYKIESERSKAGQYRERGSFEKNRDIIIRQCLETRLSINFSHSALVLDVAARGASDDTCH